MAAGICLARKCAEVAYPDEPESPLQVTTGRRQPASTHRLDPLQVGGEEWACDPVFAIDRNQVSQRELTVLGGSGRLYDRTPATCVGTLGANDSHTVSGFDLHSTVLPLIAIAAAHCLR